MTEYFKVQEDSELRYRGQLIAKGGETVGIESDNPNRAIQKVAVRVLRDNTPVLERVEDPECEREHENAYATRMMLSQPLKKKKAKKAKKKTAKKTAAEEKAPAPQIDEGASD